MSLKVTGIADCRAVLGPSQNMRAYQLQPGTSDYVTGGYPITAAQVDMQYLFGAWVIACDNAEAIAYAAYFVLAAGAFGTTPKPQTSIKLLVTIPSFSGTGRNQEILPGTDLSACTWFAEFLGY